MERVPDYQAGPLEAARPALIARLRAERAELEAAEEQLIDDAAAAGIVIEHRPEVQHRRREAAYKQKRDDEQLEQRRLAEAAVNERAQANRVSGGVASTYLAETNAGLYTNNKF